MKRMKETELYRPVVAYLENQGYRVNSEVKNCDITARRDEDLIIVELKTRFSLALVYQGINRKKMTPAVYVAVPVIGSRGFPPNYPSLKDLLRRLEIGLLLVRFLKTKTRVEAVLHPLPFKERMAPRRRQMIIREIETRYGEFNTGGSPSDVEKLTSYKLAAIRLAWHLSREDTLSPRELRSRGTGEKTQRILSDNFYGWFNRVSKGRYELDESGRQALTRYENVVDLLSNATD
jgi:hypothetical protein